MNEYSRSFLESFVVLTRHPPMRWQHRLFHRLVAGKIPAALDLPTGLGKTSVMAIWLIARAHGARLPRRLVYVVDRRAVVDQATDEAVKLRKALEGKAPHFDALDVSTRAQAKQIAAELKKRLGFDDKRKLPISTLRGAYVDNREWLDDPTTPAIVVGTVDIIGSRLLFEGYGVSRKMRPYQAGLLGVDTLIVLDEAHLVPPFAHLLRAIEQDAALWPREKADRALLPRLVILPLSATQRDPGEGEHGGVPFRLEEEDWKTDCVAKRRLEARKRLLVEPLAEKGQDKQLADAAWALRTKDSKFFRVAVYCDRRDKKDDSGGPSAQGVKEEIEKLAKGERKAGRPETKIHPVELLVGARRVHEREAVAGRLRALGFSGEKKPLEKPAFLVATSAGEVGVDIDADHMVCDLVAWERMVQRLGRVNRRGEGDAEITVFWSQPTVKDATAPTELEKRALTAFASKAVIENRPQFDSTFDASPGALRQLAEDARSDAVLKALIDKAVTPEPLRPALNRALVDAWSMTSLQTHTGRAEVGPWLRGWVEETPQTTIVWRTHLPIRVADDGRTILPAKAEIEDFFEAAPPHESEKLETETYRVADWLQTRADELKHTKPVVTNEAAETREAGALPEDLASIEDVDTDITAPPVRHRINGQDIVAIALSRRGDFDRAYTLDELAMKRDSNARKPFEAELNGKTLVIDARLGGLDEAGMLNQEAQFCKLVADVDPWAWTGEFGVEREPLVKFRIESRREIEDSDSDWKFRRSFTTRPADDPNEVERLYIFKWRTDAATEDDRSILRKAQSLAGHSEDTRAFAEKITTALMLPPPFVQTLGLAAYLHDQGKARELWQRAMGKPKTPADSDWPYAKTDGRNANLRLLRVGDGTFRHEFASVVEAEKHDALAELAELRDLALHLIAAHHGFARPNIFAFDPDLPRSLTEAVAREVALRFARLQRRWGPWGLAWWEALLRAADQQASRRLEEEG